MKLVRELTLVLWLFVPIMYLAPQANADEWDQATKVTFNEPVELPGVSLPAGTYLFRLLPGNADRNIVQVWSEDRTKLYGTFLTIPNYRLQPTDQPVLMFGEEPVKGAPKVLRAWFYPGDPFGHEFVYPQNRAVQLAKTNNQPVLSMRDQTASNITAPVKSANDAAVQAMKNEQVTAVKPSGETVAVAEVVQLQPSPSTASATTPAPTTSSSAATTGQASERNTQTASNATANKQLPQTASPLPLLGLIGLASLAIGAAARRKRAA